MILTLLLVLTVAYLFGKLWSSTRKLPPGPTPLPLIGNLHQLAIGIMKHKDIVVVLREFSEQHGKVFTVWLGPIATVHIADYEIAQKAMVKEGNNHARRWQPWIFEYSRQGMGIIATDGKFWQEHRRFSLHTLRNFGLGRNLMEEKILHEIDYHLGELDKTMKAGSVDFEVNHMLDMLVGSIINKLLVGYGYTEENKSEFFHLKHNFDEALNNLSIFDAVLGEWSTKVPILKGKVDAQLGPIRRVLDYLRKPIVVRQNAIASGEYQLTEEGEDFLGAYLIAMNKAKESGEETTLDELSLAYDLLDLWVAGMETTVVTIHWAFHHMLLKPLVMEKCKMEILSLTNCNRHLSLADRPNTPYLNATINEVQRHASILTMNLWRKAEADCMVGKHPIEKGTILTAQLSLIMSDSKHFNNPAEFRPERYLEANGKELEQMTISFGLGKRACLGESLARAELYLIIGNLLQRYDVSAVSKPTAESQLGDGLMHRPKPLTVRFTKTQ